MELEVGALVRELREQAGLTAADLARATGLSPAAISRIEAGKRRPGGATVGLLAQVLGVEPGALLSGHSGAARPLVGALAGASTGKPEADGRVLEAIQLVAQVMPGLPPAGQARVLRVIEAALS